MRQAAPVKKNDAVRGNASRLGWIVRAQPVLRVRSLTVTVRNKAPNGRGVNPGLMRYVADEKYLDAAPLPG